MLPRGATAAIHAVQHPGQAQALISQLAPDSFAVLPLRARDRTVGLLTLFNGAARGPISAADLTTAAEVATRAGLALDNARLYRQQRQLAEELQRSLLTAPPGLDRAEIVVRYLPAAEAAAVGGDWYDAFQQADGATVLVIGDVAGHDVAAAATMCQVRGLLRGIATSNDVGPAGVLTRLDSSLHLLQVDSLVTAVIARLEQDGDQRRGGVTQLRWSNADHPRADPLLGAFVAAARTGSVAALDPGATVLLYSDGLIERRDSDLDAGLARLERALTDLADRALPRAVRRAARPAGARTPGRRRRAGRRPPAGSTSAAPRPGRTAREPATRPRLSPPVRPRPRRPG